MEKGEINMRGPRRSCKASQINTVAFSLFLPALTATTVALQRRRGRWWRRRCRCKLTLPHQLTNVLRRHNLPCNTSKQCAMARACPSLPPLQAG